MLSWKPYYFTILVPNLIFKQNAELGPLLCSCYLSKIIYTSQAREMAHWVKCFSCDH